MKLSRNLFLIDSRRRFLLAAIVLGIGAFLQLRIGPDEVSAEPKVLPRIGAMLHLTGDFAMQGHAFMEGIQLAQSEINKNGGIDGVPLEVIIEDSQVEAKVSHTVAQKLLHEDRVVGVLAASSVEAKTTAPLFERAKVPLICLWDSSPELETLGDYIFGIGTWTPSSGEVAADFAIKQLSAKRAAVIDNQDLWSLSVASSFKQRFVKSGGEVVMYQSLDLAMTDFRALFSRMKSKKPEVVYAPIGYNTIAFFKQLRDLGITIPIIESDNINDELIQAAPEAFEGVFQTQSADPKSENAKAFSVRYKRHFAKDPSLLLYNAWGYDGTMILAKAMMGAISPGVIKENLYKISDYPGVSGTVSISPQGSSKVLATVFQVNNRKLGPVG